MSKRRRDIYKKMKCNKPRRSIKKGKKKMVKEWSKGSGYRMKDILDGRVERGKKTTLKVDGDSFGYRDGKKNLVKLKKYAKRMGYKKMVVVNFGEGDEGK